MRRKSERNKAKGSPEKKPEKPTRKSTRRRFRKSPSTSPDREAECETVKIVTPEESEDRTVGQDISSIEAKVNSSPEEDNNGSVWKVARADASPGEIPKLKMCRQRNTSEASSDNSLERNKSNKWQESGEGVAEEEDSAEEPVASQVAPLAVNPDDACSRLQSGQGSEEQKEEEKEEVSEQETPPEATSANLSDAMPHADRDDQEPEQTCELINDEQDAGKSDLSIDCSMIDTTRNTNDESTSVCEEPAQVLQEDTEAQSQDQEVTQSVQVEEKPKEEDKGEEKEEDKSEDKEEDKKTDTETEKVEETKVDDEEKEKEDNQNEKEEENRAEEVVEEVVKEQSSEDEKSRHSESSSGEEEKSSSKIRSSVMMTRRKHRDKYRRSSESESNESDEEKEKNEKRRKKRTRSDEYNECNDKDKSAAEEDDSVVKEKGDEEEEKTDVEMKEEIPQKQTQEKQDSHSALESAPTTQKPTKVNLKRSFTRSVDLSVKKDNDEKVVDGVTTEDKENYAIEAKSIPKRRRWGTTITSDTTPAFSVSTDSLKALVPEAKPLSLNEVRLSKDDDLDNRKPRDRKHSLSNSVENQKNKDDGRKADSIDNHIGKRKISIVKESHANSPPSPPTVKPTNILLIKNLVRPFTLNQIKELLSRTGKIVENGFWMDRIKSKCFVEYSNEDQAFETRQALHGISWPLSNPKKLQVEYATKEDMQQACESSKDQPTLRKPEAITSSDTWQQGWSQEEKNNSNKVTIIREWDLGKEEGQVHMKEKGEKKDDKKKRQRSTSPNAEAHLPPPARKFKKKEDEPPPAKLLDDLFRKTKATPCIYWLPLTNEQIAIKKEMRRQHMAEHARRLEEMRRVERNRDRDRDRRRRSPRK